MDLLPPKGQSELESLIVGNIPRDALMAFEDAYYGGDQKGRVDAASFAEGHRPSAAGQVKHFHINEAFYEALMVHGANPTPLRGTRLVVGRLGIFNIVRLNVPGHKWTNLQRSATRRELAELNEHIQRKYVQPDMFADAGREVAEATIFVLGVMDGIDSNGIAQLTHCMVAIPASDMRSWLYLKTMAEFMSLYDRATPNSQIDKATPRLKRGQPNKRTGNDDPGNP